jgi:hypothetical protein
MPLVTEEMPGLVAESMLAFLHATMLMVKAADTATTPATTVLMLKVMVLNFVVQRQNLPFRANAPPRLLGFP